MTKIKMGAQRIQRLGRDGDPGDRRADQSGDPRRGARDIRADREHECEEYPGRGGRAGISFIIGEGERCSAQGMYRFGLEGGQHEALGFQQVL